MEQLTADAARFLSGGSPALVATAGGNGVVVQNRDDEAVIELHAVDLMSTHGAGDAFVGTSAARLGGGDKLANGVSDASATATVLVSTRRENRQKPTSAEIYKLLPKRWCLGEGMWRTDWLLDARHLFLGFAIPALSKSGSVSAYDLGRCLKP
jgi:sugar/nucleoside kinase (ribokinase family)